MLWVFRLDICFRVGLGVVFVIDLIFGVFYLGLLVGILFVSVVYVCIVCLLFLLDMQVCLFVFGFRGDL